MRKKIIIVLFVIIGCIFVYLVNKENDDFTTKRVDYNGTDLLISIDGKDSETLPSSGSYYLSSYKCNSKKTKVSWDRSNYTLSVSNGTSKGRVACDLEFSSKMLLSQVEVGSYVNYTGNNGCSGNACKGYNANYVSDTDMGYCSNEGYKFTQSGWRVAYVEDDIVYLISGGAVECMCTSSDGTSGTSCSDYVSTDNVSLHLNNLDSVAVEYCNTNYAYGGVCDSTSSWAMNATDFEKITGSILSDNSCYGSNSNMSCGYNNSLIDNGGYYWFATVYNSDSSAGTTFHWIPSMRAAYEYMSSNSYGVRPVLKMDSTVYVTGGNGTSESPYSIGNS